MTFDDPFLLNDADALTDQCLVEVSTTVTTDADDWGLGALSSSSPDTHTMQCMEVPQRLFIDRATGVEVPVSMGLCVLDQQGLIQPSCRIQYNGKRYQVRSIIESAQHRVKRILLDEVG
jgi:hypothetical protein